MFCGRPPWMAVLISVVGNVPSVAVISLLETHKIFRGTRRDQTIEYKIYIKSDMVFITLLHWLCQYYD